MRTVVGLFDYIEDAESAVIRLEAAGINRHDISVMADETRRHATQFNEGSASAAEDKGEVIAVDAAAGAALGGATGLLMALTGLVIPGFGPIVAAGWLVSTLAGAAVGAGVGGLVGALTGAGIPLEDAIYYKEGIKAGATLIAVRVEASRAPQVAALMEQQGAVNTEERGENASLLSPSDSSVLQRPLDPAAPGALGSAAPAAPPMTPSSSPSAMMSGTGSGSVEALTAGRGGARIYTHVPPETPS